jgi:hypothetical protein
MRAFFSPKWWACESVEAGHPMRPLAGTIPEKEKFVPEKESLFFLPTTIKVL